MRTLNEIKTSYECLLANIDLEFPKIAENQAVLIQLEEGIYDESTHHSSSKYLIYLQQLMNHAHIVNVMRSYAEELITLKDEVAAKIASIKSYGLQFIEGENLRKSLIKIAIECESIAGELYLLGGELDEKMLYLTQLYLSNNVVHDAFHVMAEEHQEIFNFCIPWIKYHRNEENNPLMIALQSLPTANAQRPRITG